MRGEGTLTQRLIVGVAVFLVMLPLFAMAVLRPLEPHWRSLRFVDVPLIGAESDNPRPELDILGVMDSSFQSEFQSWFGQHLGMRGRLVLMNNQLDYALFSKTRMSNTEIVIGKDRWLYEESYIKEWLRKVGLSSDKDLDVLVARMLAF